MLRKEHLNRSMSRRGMWRSFLALVRRYSDLASESS